MQRAQPQGMTHDGLMPSWLHTALKVLVAQSGPAVCNPMDYSLTGSSIHGILHSRNARMLEWVGSHSLLQRIFPGIELRLHILYHLSDPD